MSNIPSEAVAITKDLGQVVFVGATALILHKIADRSTHDIDIAFAISESENLYEVLEKYGYIKHKEGKKDRIRSPRGFPIDVFIRDVSGIPIDRIMETACEIKRGRNNLKVASIEVLILAKYRAHREHDMSDLDNLIIRSHRKINYELLKNICNDLSEYQLIYSYIQLIKKSNT